MKKVKIRNTIIVFICVIALIAIADYALTIYAYDSNIVHRYESYEPKMPKITDFPGLNRTAYTFENNKGEKLAGYLYSYDQEPKGIIIFAHGLGAGHSDYMGYADYFASNGYYVFAFDVTGCDDSEGDSIRGVPQTVVDLDRAISFVEESGNFPDLPIGLWGHSWGAYSVSAVLNYHPEVKAVIECAGCNASSDIFQLGAEEEIGDFNQVMMPCVKLHEFIHYGKYATKTAMDGFGNTDAAIMCVHSDSDEVVAAKYGYDKYIKKYKDDPRFTFLVLEGRDHNYMFDDDSYRQAFNEEFNKWRDSLDYDPRDKVNYDRFVEDKANYIRENLDREKWSHKRDPELFKQFLDFYDSNM